MTVSSTKVAGEPAPEASGKIPRRRYERGLLTAVVLGFVLIPIVMLIVTLSIAEELSRARALNNEINELYIERSQLKTVFSLLQDAETGQRGYVITGKQSFLEPYNSAEANFTREFATLEAMERTNTITYPDKAILTAKLKVSAQARMTSARNTVAVRASKGEAAAAARVTQGRGKQAMDQVRLIIARMDAEEAKALGERIAFTERDSQRSQAIIISMFIALGALLLAAYGLVLRQAHTRHLLLIKVQATAARQTATFENTQDGIITFNPSGTIESVNRAAEAMFGYGRAELERRDISTLLDVPGDDRLFLDRLGAGADLSAGMTREFQGWRRSGQAFLVEVSMGLFALPEGGRIVASMRDISERRRAETLKAEFVSTVSHELRTPLTSIAASLGLLMGGAGGELPERAGRLLSIAQSNSQRLVRLINDILDMEKIESGKMRFNMEPQDLADVARKGVDAITGMAADARVRIVLEIADAVPAVMGDADRIAQVVANLLSNAVKFSPREGVVEVMVDTSATGAARMRVRDRGPGIPPEFRNRIFTKFAQADASDTRQKGGTGLGLSISKEIVERHGGRLSFESELGEGSTFIVELPAVSDLGDVPVTGTTRVLMCEDDIDFAQLLKESLQRDGLAVDVVTGVAEAEAALAGEQTYAALLLDVRLPDGNGLELLGRLRGNPRTSRLPVMIMSAENGVGHALDVVDWMQKPIDFDRLRRVLAAALGGGRERIQVLHVEDDADVRQLVADALGAHCTVVSVDGLQSARSALSRQRPDVVILDLALLDGSGADLLPELKGPDGRSIPVVIFSAQSAEEQAVSHSVDAVLTKSKMSLDQLSQTVRELASAVQPAESKS